jgi:hypothetical protein
MCIRVQPTQPHGPAAFGSFGGSPLRLREFALCSGKFFFLSAEETRILDPFSRRKRGKALQPQIDPDGQIIERQWLRLYLASETGIPVSKSIPSDGERFDLAFHGTMQDHFHRSNFGKEQAVLPQRKPKLLEGETMVAIIATKPRIARFLSCLHSSKERLERQIHTLLDILQDLREHLPQFRMLLLPCPLASGQRLVVDPTAHLQRLQESGSLAPGGLKAILERFLHMRSSTVHLGVLLVFDGSLPGSQGRTAYRGNEIRMGPQTGKSLLQTGNLLAKQTRATTLDPPHEFMNSELWVYFASQFHCDLMDDFLPSFLHTVHQYVAPILGTKTDMIFAGRRA